MTDQAPFQPDWLSPPGETVEDLLEERGWTQAEFAERTGFTKKHVNELLRGKAGLTADTAVRLASVLGSTPQFWLTREAQYRAALEERERIEALATQADWLRELPLGFMKRRGWLTGRSGKGEQVSECLAYFGVATPDAWSERYGARLTAAHSSKHSETELGAVAAWLRRAEILAEARPCRDFDRARFRDALSALRALTLEPDPQAFVPDAEKRCGEAGVALVLVPTPPRCPASAATWWLTPRKALLALGLRGLTNDRFWLALFHAAAHLLLHGKKERFLEGLDGLDADREAEADAFARNLLIPPPAFSALEELAASRPVEASAVERLALELGIAPGLVVDRLQHEGWLRRSSLKELRVSGDWSAFE